MTILDQPDSLRSFFCRDSNVTEGRSRMMNSNSIRQDSIVIRDARTSDVQGIVAVVGSCGPYLTRHGDYLYFVYSRCFSQTCAVAVENGQVIGCVRRCTYPKVITSSYESASFRRRAESTLLSSCSPTSFASCVYCTAMTSALNSRRTVGMCRFTASTEILPRAFACTCESFPTRFLLLKMGPKKNFTRCRWLTGTQRPN